MLHHVLWCETPLALRGISEERRVLAFAASCWLQALRGERQSKECSLPFAARAVDHLHDCQKGHNATFILSSKVPSCHQADAKRVPAAGSEASRAWEAWVIGMVQLTAGATRDNPSLKAALAWQLETSR